MSYTMQSYSDLPESVRDHLLDIEVFINDVDTEEIDTENAVNAFNRLVDGIRALKSPLPDGEAVAWRELREAAKALDYDVERTADHTEWFVSISRLHKAIKAVDASPPPVSGDVRAATIEECLKLVVSAKYAVEDEPEISSWNAACEHIEEGIRALSPSGEKQ